ncbi:MAG: alanine aminopeptidase [Myxococcales bacterium]|nr:alanine aminopeptidase [Myxococcales bacterium]
MRHSIAITILVGCSSSAPRITVPAPPPTGEPTQVVEKLPDPAPPVVRLSGDVTPIRQRLELTIVPTADHVTGTTHVDATVVKPTRVVWLDATDLKISRATLDGKPARVIAGGNDFVGITTDVELARGPLAIDLAFEAGIDRTRSRGVYAEKEGAETYAYTFFEPIDARRAFPCFDEPAYKIPWQLTFHVKQDHVALANAAVASEIPEPAGMKRVELAESKPMPSYLVAFVVGPFEVIDGGTGGRAKTPIRFVVPKGRSGELGWAKQVTPRVVAALEDYFDMDYPFGKLDVAVVPRYWGTMEHPGIVAMGQPLTLIRPEQESRSRKQAYANILAHELAHYWFGDYVTMAWWDDTWLNEALGEWMDMIITDAVEPGWRYPDDRVGYALAAMSADETLSTHPMRREVTTKEGIATSFDNDITYFKGATVLRMFEAWTGSTQWRDFIRGYLRSHAWSNASADDFIGAMKSLRDGKVAKAFSSFLSQPGVPRVEVEMHCEPHHEAIVLRQRRSLPAGLTDPAPQPWDVPVCVRFGDATRVDEQCVDLAEAEARIDLIVQKTKVHWCPTWIVANAGARGYYRSVIDPKGALALLDLKAPTAKVAKLTAAEKMMTIADLRSMVQRDELPIDRLLALVPSIVADPDPKVATWALEAASFHADALEDKLYLADRAWRTRTFASSARQLGWHRDKADSDERHQLRQQLVPMIARHDDKLGTEAEKLAERWLADRAGVDDDLVGAVLRVAAYRGDAARFERFLTAAKAARDRSEQNRILGAFGGFRDPALATRALDLVLGHDFDLRESVSIIYGVLYDRDTRDLALRWLATHIDELLGRMRSDEASGFLSAIAGASCDPKSRATIGELVTARAAKVEGAQAATARGLEQSDQCIAELGRELPSLTRFLVK